MISENKLHGVMLFFWLFTFPPSIYIAYTYFPSLPVNWSNILLLLVLLLFTMLLPMKFQNSIVSFERWITFTVFFQYGLFTELLFMQFALVVLMLSNKSDIRMSHRFFINSSVFSVVSLGSGFIFNLFGGIPGTFEVVNIVLLGILYALSYTIINSILLQTYTWLEMGEIKWIDKSVAWDVIITVLLLPFSLALYFLNGYFGSKALLLIGIPFILVLVISRKYNQSDNLNEKLSSATVLGHKLADNLGFNAVLESFLYNLKDVISYKEAYIIDFVEQEKLIPLISSEDGLISKNIKLLKFPERKHKDDGVDIDNIQIFSSETKAVELKYITFPADVQSVMTAPIKRGERTEGFLVLTSSKKNIFQPFEKDILKVLCGYLATALVKARYYENALTNSETCALTKLNNFRHLETKMDEEIIRYHTREISALSTIILDIDHFKSINDTYGHQSGNDLLIALAELLKEFVETDTTLARFGGEEFVFLFPNKSKFETVLIAEMIRKKVDEYPFTIIPDLSESRTPFEVHMTISLGVSSVPDDAQNAKSLLRNADIAMYVGGKQAGRNRVGVYDEQQVESF